jgi:ribosomal protein S18 acetylase RimI-like enzyme
VTARPAEDGDRPGVLDLRRAWDMEVHGEPRTASEFLAAHWPAGGHWVVDGPGGRLDGYAAVDSGGGLDLWTRPGADLDVTIGALVAAAAAHQRGRLEAVLPAWHEDACRAFERHGFSRVTDVLEMGIHLGAATLAEPRWPEGVQLRPFRAERDAPEVHATLVEAFAGSDERVAPYDEWLPWVTGDPSYDPALVFVADAGEAVAGVAQCWTEGFVKDLAVRPAFRGRGLGEALLHAVFAEFARRGVGEVRLKVDASNPTGAVRLYRRVGMAELRRHAVYMRG